MGIIHRDSCSVKSVKSPVYKSFEHMTARVASGSSLYHIFVIYQSPPSSANKLTFATFMSEFSEFMAEAALTKGQLLIVGDFNIHMDSDSSESEQSNA